MSLIHAYWILKESEQQCPACGCDPCDCSWGTDEQKPEPFWKRFWLWVGLSG